MDDRQHQDLPPSHPSHPDYKGRVPLPGEGPQPADAKPADAPDPAVAALARALQGVMARLDALERRAGATYAISR